jgi:hypothetical protein
VNVDDLRMAMISLHPFWGHDGCIHFWYISCTNSVEFYLADVPMTDQISCDDILDVLRSNYLFFGLSDAEMVDVVHSVEVYQVDRGTTICKEGDKSQALYFIHSGKACQTRQTKGKNVFVKQLSLGSSWGEDCVHEHARMRYRVVSISTVLVIRIDRAVLFQLTDRIPQLATNLQVGGRARELQQQVRLEWLRDGEEIIFMGRKHPIFLIKRLVIPILLFILTLFGTATIIDLTTADPVTIWLVCALFIFGSLVWSGWNALDWSNDYSIVTNLRIVWLERTYGLYDTRQEVPLTTLQSINVESDQLGRIFGYGDVIVRTFSGPLTLPDVESPDDVANLIRDHWEQSRVRQRQDEIGNIEQTLRMRLTQNTAAQTNLGTTQIPPVAPEQVEPGFLQELFADFFKVRTEANGVTTYRKHWFVLVKMTWKPVLISFLMFILWMVRLAEAFTFPSVDAVFGFAAFIWMGMLSWMAYQYIDWRNDIYQITNDEILDVDKTPLGKEEKKMAQLENIMAIEYKRLGIMGLLLNFGTVTINVGNSMFTFENVYDPSQVQQDLFRRMADHEYRKKQEDIRSDRERVSDWITTYHNHQDEFRTNSGTNQIASQPNGIG